MVGHGEQRPAKAGGSQRKVVAAKHASDGQCGVFGILVVVDTSERSLFAAVFLVLPGLARLKAVAAELKMTVEVLPILPAPEIEEALHLEANHAAATPYRDTSSALRHPNSQLTRDIHGMLFRETCHQSAQPIKYGCRSVYQIGTARWRLEPALRLGVLIQEFCMVREQVHSVCAALSNRFVQNSHRPNDRLNLGRSPARVP